jgi:hypothetical protein
LKAASLFRSRIVFEIAFKRGWVNNGWEKSGIKNPSTVFGCWIESTYNFKIFINFGLSSSGISFFSLFNTHLFGVYPIASEFLEQSNCASEKERMLEE